MEAFVALRRTAYNGVSVVSGTGGCDISDRGVDVAGARDALGKVIGLVCVRRVLGILDVLLPDDDRITSGLVGGPLGINRGRLFQRHRKIEFGPVGASLIRIPSAKGMAEERRLIRLRRRHAFQELCGGIARALGVFLEDQPVARRRFGRQDHIGGHLDRGLVRDRRAVFDYTAVVSFDFTCGRHKPPLELLVGGLGRIGLVHLIGDALDVLCGKNAVGLDNDADFVHEGDVEYLEHHRIVGDLRAIRNAGIQFCLHRILDVVDRQRRIRGRDSIFFVAKSFHRVILDICPPAEHHVCRDAAHTGIVNHLIEQGIALHRRSADIALLHDHGRDRIIAIHEVDSQPGVVAGARDGIDGEVLRREGDRIIRGNNNAALRTVAFFIDIVNCQDLSVAESVIRNGNIYRLFRLPCFAVLIENGDVITRELGFRVSLRRAAKALGAPEDRRHLIDSGHGSAHRQHTADKDGTIVLCRNYLLFGFYLFRRLLPDLLAVVLLRRHNGDVAVDVVNAGLRFLDPGIRRAGNQAQHHHQSKQQGEDTGLCGGSSQSCSHCIFLRLNSIQQTFQRRPGFEKWA